MSRKIHLLIPMSGQGKRYRNAGYSAPKPMIEVSGIPMIKRLLDCFPPTWKSHAVMAQNHADTDLPAFLSSISPEIKLSYVPVHDEGPIKAIEEGVKNIPDEEAVFVSYCDYGMLWDWKKFEEFAQTTDCDACVISYIGFHPHYLSPVTYAYSRIENGKVVEVKEKGSFTNDRQKEFASSGAYYFKSAGLLKQALNFQRELNLIMNGEFYTSLTVEALLRKNPNLNVQVFEIPYFFQWGTPNDLRNFEFYEKSFEKLKEYNGKTGSVDQILMPMAGFGSRFKNQTNTPKPLLPVPGGRMFQQALASLPASKKNIIVTTSAIANVMKKENLTGSLTVIELSQTPAGQALTVEAGLDKITDGDLIVSSCDHAIVLNPETWKNFIQDPQCDAAIFTVRGYPGTIRKPESYAYVSTETTMNTPFPKVKHVSVKRQISDDPSLDLLLVGTFWFKDKNILKNGIKKLKTKDIRVNGELYLDSIFELMIQDGKTVRTIELDGYINWGDPDSFAESSYWYKVFIEHGFSKETSKS